jgi:capsular polysaccharide biosynthesis protein
MEETISLKEIFQTLKKRAWMIVIITMIATMISGIVSYFVLTPIYQSSTQILVNQSNKEQQQAINTGEIQTNIQLINTYRVIITGPVILDKVKDKLDLDSSIDNVSVNSEQNSQVFTISVQNPDPALAVNIANTIAETFQKEITTIMNVDNVTILSPAELAEKPSPIKPQPTLNMAIALVVGLMAGVGLAFLLEYLDNTIKSEQDIERILGLPVIGVVGQMSEGDTRITRNRKVNTRIGSENIGS